MLDYKKSKSKFFLNLQIGFAEDAQAVRFSASSSMLLHFHAIKRRPNFRKKTQLSDF